MSGLAVAVLVGAVSVSVILSVLLATGVRNEKRALLHERTSLAALLVSNSFAGTGQDLSFLDQTTHPTPTSTDAFTASAAKLLTNMSTVAVVRSDGSTASVIAAAGTGMRPGQALTGDVAQLVARAATTRGLIPGLVHEGSSRYLSYALQGSSGLVLYEQLNFDFSKPIAIKNDSEPFSDLQGAIYAAPTADPNYLLITDTAHLPLSGQTVQQTLTIGNAKWLVVARANGPLVGVVTANAPWGALAAGLLVAVLAAGIVETLARRRRYALTLVDERTTALQETLARQAQLEINEREARQVAEAANRSKSEFLSRMSHELRTPLNAVLGFGQLLELDELTCEQQESVTQIIKGGRHLLSLINDVLDISRIETGNLAMSLEPTSVLSVTDEVLSLMQPLAAASEIELRSEKPALADSHVLADHQRFKQILLNLVSNAIKYNRHGGKVNITSQAAADGRTRITVSDTGSGIDPALKERLFLPFERLGAERTDIEGSGVGLALSKRLAEAMGGSIDVESEPGRGSSFWIELPAAGNPLADAKPETVPEASAYPGNGTDRRHKVLYIEDNPPNLRLVERILAHRQDTELLTAIQGRLGLVLAQQHIPALILLDLHLPDLSGSEVLRQLKMDTTTATIPVVILTADATPGQLDRLLSQGASAYLTKPLDVPQLLQLVEEHVGAPATVTAKA